MSTDTTQQEGVASPGENKIPSFDELAQEYVQTQLRGIVPRLRAAMMDGTPALSVSSHERMLPHFKKALHDLGYVTKPSEPRSPAVGMPVMPTFFILLHATPEDELGAEPTRVSVIERLSARPGAKPRK